MKRTEFLIEDIKRSVEAQLSSSGGGISDLEILQYLNSAQDRIFSKIVSARPKTFLAETQIDLVADQEAYTLPSTLYMGTNIVMVEYLYGSGSVDYAPLPARVLFDRRSDIKNSYPDYYIRKGNQILIQPTPSTARTNGLRVTYQRRLRDLDIRRGVITSAALTGTTLNTITLDLTPTLAKDDGTVIAAANLLNKLDYICVVDKDGTAVLDEIPVDSYDSTTGVITVTSGFTTTVLAAAFASQYVVAGTYSTTNCELPDITERYLVAYATFKLLRRQGRINEPEWQKQELQAIESDIIDSFENPDQDIMRLPLDSPWDDGYYGRFS